MKWLWWAGVWVTVTLVFTYFVGLAFDAFDYSQTVTVLEDRCVVVIEEDFWGDTLAEERFCGPSH